MDNRTTVTEAERQAFIPELRECHPLSETGSDIFEERRRRSGMEASSAEGSVVMPPS